MDYKIASGSIQGMSHRLVGKNNQDSCDWFNSENLAAAVVCDGCSGGKHSEVGSKLVSRLMLKELITLKRKPNSKDLEYIRQNILSQIRVLANAMGGNFSQVVNDYFLATLLGFIITSDGAVIFGLGDGVIFANGEEIKTDISTNNQPPYFGYDLLDSSLLKNSPEILKIRILKEFSADELDSILIGTDGVNDFIRAEEKNMPGKSDLVGSISQFWQDEKFIKNPDNIRRKLFLANKDAVKYLRDKYDHIIKIEKESGLLPDDTTIVVAKRQ